VKTLYLARYAQSPFGKLGNYPIEAMIGDAGSKDLDVIAPPSTTSL